MLLDTHAALWLRAGNPKLGPAARAEIEHAWQAEEVAMSAISFWEMAMLREKGRIEYPDDVSRWWLEQLGQGLIEIPVDGEIGIRGQRPGRFPRRSGRPQHRCKRNERPPVGDRRPSHPGMVRRLAMRGRSRMTNAQ